MYMIKDIHYAARLLTKLLGSYTFGQEKFLESKGENDFVTNVDLELQEIILNCLPDIADVPIMSEELECADLTNADNFWIIDPLDGTSNFIAGIPHIATSIALIEKGEVVFGFVYDYIAQNSYYAGFGFGAFKNGMPLNITKGKKSGPNIVGTSSGFIKKWMASGQFEAFSLSNFRILGSQALQLCFVADGKLSCNLSIEAKIWDDAAGLLIVREAGGSYYSDTLMKIGVFGCMNKALNLFSCAIGSSSNEHKLKHVMENVICKM